MERMKYEELGKIRMEGLKKFKYISLEITEGIYIIFDSFYKKENGITFYCGNKASGFITNGVLANMNLRDYSLGRLVMKK